MVVEELKAVCHIHVGTRAIFPQAQRTTLAGRMEVELCRLTAGCLTFSTAVGLTPRSVTSTPVSTFTDITSVFIP